MNVFITIVSTIFVFGILILFHEFGHFIIAKKLKVKVEKFSIGFGPPLIKMKKGETEYAIAAIPFGGYVKMAGENPEEGKGEKGEFISKTPFQRMLIVLAGPAMSFLLPLLIFYVVFMVGFPTLTTKVGELIENYPAEEVGIQKDDIIVSVNDKNVNDWEEMSKIISRSYGKMVTLKIKRDTNFLMLNITPKEETFKDMFGAEHRIGLIGIRPSDEVIKTRFGPIESLSKSISKVIETVYLTIKFLSALLTRSLTIPVREAIGGPLLIAELAGEAAKTGFMSLLLLTAFISVNLGVINLIPLPVLDGGYLVFLLIEKVRGKPVNEKAQAIIQHVMIFLLIGLMLLVTYNDLARIINRKLINKNNEQNQNNLPR